jgi:DNA-binding XRE family transcriptional regulator
MAKNVDFSKFSSEQLAVARMITDPDCRMTNAQIAEEVGISERTIYRWREKEDYSELLESLSDRIMKTFISEVDKAVMKSVKSGSVKAMELAYKRSGKLVDKKEVTSDVDVTVNGVGDKSNEELMAELVELEKKAGLSE